MKYIERWSLMRNSVPDNLIEHSYQVAYITQALCLIKNKLYGGNVNVEKPYPSLCSTTQARS